MTAAYLTTAEVAARFRAPEATVRWWRFAGYGPDSIKVGRRALYPVEAVEAFEAQRRRRGGREGCGTRSGRMNAKRPPGGETGGPTDQRRPSCGPVVMVTQATDGWSQEFGQPSNYSLDPVTLARHVRQLRRSGWQSWEVKVRFDLGRGEVA